MQPNDALCARCGKRTDDIHTCTPPSVFKHPAQPKSWRDTDLAKLAQAKAASLENVSSDTRWGFEQGANWMAQVMKARQA